VSLTRRRKSSDPLVGLTRPYAQRLMAEVAEWRREGSDAQRAEILGYLEDHGATHIGVLSNETGLTAEAIRRAAPDRIKKTRNTRGQWREVLR
jgi:NaMN:DMB phosphoribosyltransferase